MQNQFRILLRDALKVNRRHVGLGRWLGAGVAFLIPMLLSLLIFGDLQYGLLATLGSFTYLYAFPIPYVQQAKRLAFVGVGIILATLLGSLLSQNPFGFAVAMGLFAAIIVYIFNAFKLVGPTAIFFVLVFGIAGDMPAASAGEMLIRTSLVGFGALTAWLIAMSGFFINPHRPEQNATQKVYQQLTRLTEKVGSQDCNQERYRTMAALKEAEKTLIAGQLPWKPTEAYIRLLHLVFIANEYLLYLSNNYTDKKQALSPEVTSFLKTIAIHLKQKKQTPPILCVPQLEDKTLCRYLEKMLNALTQSIDSLKPVAPQDRPSLKETLINAFDRNSLVFLTALRIGLIVTISALLANYLEAIRSYWIPLSCMAVLEGSSMIATFHRALQRSSGTLIGILVASLILYLQPSAYIIAFLIFIFTILTEILVVKNYGLAVIVITQNALLISETLAGGEISLFSFAGHRVMDVVIGGAIGLIGVYLIGRRSASSRIPRALIRTLRNESQLLMLLFSQPRQSTEMRIKTRLIILKNNLSNLNALYDAAIGEIPQDEKLIDYYWPIIYSVDKLAFLLERAISIKDRPVLSDTDLSSMLFTFETLANLASFDDVESPKTIPDIPGFYGIIKEIQHIQDAFYKEKAVKTDHFLRQSQAQI